MHLCPSSKSLGASEVIDRKPFADKAKPLAKECWAGAVDMAGGNTLANVLSQTQRGGAVVAACGLEESMELPTSVAPFILCGVNLYGIDWIPIWTRNLLESLSTEISFDDLPQASAAIVKGQIRGRTIVKIPQ